jgi:hypothetical protein
MLSRRNQALEDSGIGSALCTDVKAVPSPNEHRTFATHRQGPDRPKACFGMPFRGPESQWANVHYSTKPDRKPAIHSKPLYLQRQRDLQSRICYASPENTPNGKINKVPLVLTSGNLCKISHRDRATKRRRCWPSPFKEWGQCISKEPVSTSISHLLHF